MLKAMLNKARDEESRVDGIVAWETFKRFAALPVTAEPPERIDESDGDLLLFEWYRLDQPARPTDAFFTVHLVRQFSVLDADDDYDRMEQLQCDIALDLPKDDREPGSGAIWSDGDLASWVAEVEASSVFELLRTATVAEVSILLEVI